MVADLESPSRDAVVGGAKKIHESFCHIQQARREAGVEFPKNLLKLLSDLAEQPILASSSTITRNLKHLEAQRNALCGEFGRSRERFQACESEFVAELNMFKAKAAGIKTSPDASVALVHCLEWELARLKAAEAEEI